MSHLIHKSKSLLLTVFVGICLLGFWQLAYTYKLASRLVLPSPLGVFEMTLRQLQSTDWYHHIGITAMEALLGLAIGVCVAILCGAVFAYVDLLRKSLFPYILAAQTFPKIAIAPLLVAWLGYGIEPKVLIASILAFFPVFLNTMAGLTDIKQDEIYLFRALRATAMQEFLYLRFPHALSYIFPALTISAVMALIGAIVGEFVGATSGLGFLIQQMSFQGDLDSVYAVLIILSMIGLLLYGGIKALENWVKYTK